MSVTSEDSRPGRGYALRRFLKQSSGGKGAVVLPNHHPAVREARTLFPGKVVHASLSEKMLLKSGHHSRKIGKTVLKGRWRGMPIFTLTLEERATCPSTCRHWSDCYGNHMPWPERIMPGVALENRLDRELRVLSEMHHRGFVVRLHVLGDFYSVHYVERWSTWLRKYPALHVFGYTAWASDTPIGAAVAGLRDERWDRFAVRTSDGKPTEPRALTREQAGAITCPAQTGRTECCSTCTLCWSTKRDIAFLPH